MLFISILFLIFFILVIFNDNEKNLFLWFLLLSVLGWFLSILSLIFYIGKLNYYRFIAFHLFTIPNDLWKIVNSLNPDIILVNRLINAGVLLFLYSILSFALTFTNIFSKNRTKKILIYLLIAPFFEFIIYDPIVYKNIYLFLFNREYILISFHNFYTIVNILHTVTSVINACYLIATLGIFIYNAQLQRNYYFLKNYAVFLIIAMTSIIIPYFVIFSWAPKILINISAIAGTIKFIRIDLAKNRTIYNIFPYFVIVSFIITIFSIYKLKKIDDAYKNHTIQISKSIETANIGARIFSHSMKNQLISILSDAEYLKETYENYDEIKKITQNIVSTVNQSIDRLNTLHQRFNTIYINMNAVELSTPVENALNYQCKIPSNISVIKKYDSNLPICLIDIEHMTECICVILNNAIEAIKGKEGTITITLQKLNNWGIISIEDTGCGIDKKILNKIFEPFFTTKSSRLNWGIGLSYVHKIVSAHKGKVIVESELEKGTILKIFLPVMKHG